ncbi:MAG TPA: hypothetical protein DCM71_09910, partial [Runella sp.]|nr:hypothetical protein [Runella sp.]
KELWRVDNLNEEELRNYHHHIENLRYQASMAWTMQIDAEDRAKKQKAMEIAKGMKHENLDPSLIIKLTGLTQEEINSL